MNTTVQKASKIEEFKSALTDGISGIVRAAKIYVSAIDEDSSNSEKFQNELKDFVPSSAWAQFEAVGRKWMHPRLLLGGVHDFKKSRIIKRLPYSTQEQIFEHKRFKLLTSTGDTLSADVLECTPEQCEQLFNGDSIRSLGEQRAYIESKASSEPLAKSEIEVMPYTISDNRITFRRGCVMNRAELKRVLQEM